MELRSLGEAREHHTFPPTPSPVPAPLLQYSSQCPSLSGSSLVSLCELPAALCPLAALASKGPEHRLGITRFIICQLPLRLNESPCVAGTLPLWILHNVRHLGGQLPSPANCRLKHSPREISQEPLSLLLLPRNTSLSSSKGKHRHESSSLVLGPHI